MIGTTILNYRIEEKLGDGGMGVVYRATDTKLGRQVALKFLPAFVSSRHEEKARFMAEARTASALDHPNIATIYEVNEVDDKIFYAMSLVEGLTLKSLRQQGPITHKQIIQIAIQVADGLAHAHDRGVIHRDIKPQNIMVTTKGLVKILDFGLATMGTNESISGTSSTAGTAAYLSPEQAQGEAATPQSDLFSLGVVMYELLSGELPFKGDHPAALLYSVVHEDPEPLAHLVPDTPPAIIDIVERLLAKDPAKRPASAVELADELRSIARDLDYSSFSGNVQTFKYEAKLGWRSILVVFLAVLALGIGAAYVLEPDSSSTPQAADQYDVAVMYFDDLTGNTDSKRTGDMITELLITDLSRSPYLRVLSSQRLYDILKQSVGSDQNQIDRSVATDIARRARARFMITGSYASTGDRSRLTVNVIEVATGEIVYSQQVEGDDLFTMVDSASAQIRGEMDVPQDQHFVSKGGVAAATTDNAEAYLQYIEGTEAYHRLDWEPAIAHFDSAIALDSNFALAYVRAGVVAFSSNRASRGYDYLRHASQALKTRTLPPRDSLLVAAFSAMVNDDHKGASEIFQQLEKRFPDDKEAYFWYGNHLRSLGATREAIKHLEKSLELDPTYPFALLTLVEAYQDIDERAKAIATAERYRNLRPNEAMPRLQLADMYIQEDEMIKAREELGEALRLDPKSFYAVSSLAAYYARAGQIDSIKPLLEPFMEDTANSFQGVAHNLWASTLMLDGRFHAGFKELRHAADLEHTYGDSLGVVRHWLTATNYYLMLENADSARATWNRAYALSATQLKYTATPAIIEAVAGNYKKAADIAERIQQDYGEIVSDKQLQIAKSSYNGRVAFLKKEYAEALKLFVQARKLADDPNENAFWVGRCYLETGDYENARTELKSCVARYSPLSSSGYWIRSWYYLGRAEEALGNRGDAVSDYRRFLRFWGRADIKLPYIQDARNRLDDLAEAS